MFNATENFLHVARAGLCVRKFQWLWASENIPWGIQPTRGLSPRARSFPGLYDLRAGQAFSSSRKKLLLPRWRAKSGWRLRRHAPRPEKICWWKITPGE
jgi:hypothetical protein